MYDFKALYEAHSVPEAIRLLEEHPDAVILAGGSDVLIDTRSGKLAGREMISIYGLDELRGVSIDEENNIRIGSLTSFSSICRDPIIKEHIPVLAQACSMVGSPQIRSIGTIGGNTCNGVTSADSASTLMAYDAIMEVSGPDGVRRIPISQWYIRPHQVAKTHEELQTAILIPLTSCDGYTGCYMKYGMRNAMEIATTGCSVNVKLSADKKVFEDVRVGFGVAAPVPMRARTAEQVLTGREVTEENIQFFAEKVLEDVRPRDSWRASRDFRLHLCRTLAEDALREAIRRNGGAVNG